MVDRKILIGVGVAGAVGAGAAVLYFMSRTASAGTQDCSSHDWMAKNKSMLGRCYKEVSVYKGVGIYKDICPTTQNSHGDMVPNPSYTSYRAWIDSSKPSSDATVAGVNQMIDQACGSSVSAPMQDWNHIL